MARTRQVGQRETAPSEPQQKEDRSSDDGWGRRDAADSLSRVDGGVDSRAMPSPNPNQNRSVNSGGNAPTSWTKQNSNSSNNRSDGRGSQNHHADYKHGEFKRGYDRRREYSRERFDRHERNYGFDRRSYHHQPRHAEKRNQDYRYRRDNRVDYRDRDDGRHHNRYERGRISHQSRAPDRSQSRHTHPLPKRIKTDPSVDRLKRQKEKQSLELANLELQIKIEENKKKLEAVRNQSAALDDTKMGAVACAQGTGALFDNKRSIPAAAAAAASAPSDDEDLFSDTSDVDPRAPSFNVDSTSVVDSDVGKYRAKERKKIATTRSKRTPRKNADQPVEELVSSNDRSRTTPGHRGRKAAAKTKKNASKKADKSAKSKKEEDIKPFSEQELMGKYKPTIVDHRLATNICVVTSKNDIYDLLASKILVQWDENNGPAFGSQCRSWISIRDFVFPSCVKSYISKCIKDEKYVSERDTLRKIKKMVEDIEEEQKWGNAIQGLNPEEGSDLKEFDFCCFMCTCIGKDDELKKTVKNCEEFRKFHRACCHGFTNANDLNDFCSAAGRAFKSFLDENNTDELSDEVAAEETEDSAAKTGEVTICSGGGFSESSSFQDLVVLSINTGVGSVPVALKEMGRHIKKIIHVEDDPVVQHVIRYHYDSSYGYTNFDDGTEHVVGLYESLDDFRDDPEDLVKRFGPIDLVICSSRGKTEFQQKRYTERFLTFCQNVKKLNKIVHEHNGSLLYLIETCPGSCSQIETTPGENDLSFCLCHSRFGDNSQHAFICNWPLDKERSSLKKLGHSLLDATDNTLENILGLRSHYAIGPVSALFKELKKAYTVGFSQARWSTEVHPNYWNFLTLGPNGHDFQVKRNSANESLLDPLQLRLKSPATKTLLCDVDYSTELLKGSMSVHWLKAMMKPLLNDDDNAVGSTSVRSAEHYENTLESEQKEDIQGPPLRCEQDVDMDATEEIKEAPTSQVQRKGENSGTESQNDQVKFEDQQHSGVGIDENESSTDEEQLNDMFNDIQPLDFDI